MINGEDKQRHRRSMHDEREELQQATQHFIRSMFRMGVRLSFFPVNRLPQTPQQHFKTAGREFTCGLASLVREFADGLEELAHDANTSSNCAEGPQTDREME
jgi:hypothetical protein